MAFDEAKDSSTSISIDSCLPSSSTTLRPKASSSRLADTARMERVRNKIHAAEQTHNHSLATLLPFLSIASAPLRAAAEAALLGTMEWLTRTSASRWRRQPKPDVVEEEYEAQKARVAALSDALKAYRSTGRQALVAPFADFFDPATGKLLPNAHFSPASLFLVLSASDNLVVYAVSLLAFVSEVNDLEGRRRVNKLWWPTGVRKIGNLLKGGKRGGGVTGDGDNPDKIELVGEEEEEEGTQAAKAEPEEEHFGTRLDERELATHYLVFFARAVLNFSRAVGRDPNAKPPRNGRQRFALRLYALGQWFHEPDTIFAIKYAVLSVLLWLPQVFPSSA